MVYDNIVIGSGISALGCILGLLKSKKKILCIDGSNITDVQSYEKPNDRIIYCSQKLPLKNFKFRRKSERYFDPIEVLESKSFGGLSNVWGANSLRFLENDFEGWPISYETLKDYYEECEDIMRVSHFNDKISKELKIDNNKFDESKLNLYSNFIKVFFSNRKHNNIDLISGFARVALNPDVDKCPGCFFGCDHVFNTKNYFKKLISNKDIDYKKNLILKRFSLLNDVIELEFDNSNNEKILTKKLFIGAGAIATPKIIINSLKPKKNLDLKESQGFYMPCIYLGKNFNNGSYHHTLSQANILFKNNLKHKIGKIHYEIKYDPALTQISLKKQFHLLHNFIPNFIKERIFIITGFINSDHSTYEAKINSDNLTLKIIENNDKMKKIKKEINTQLNLLGSIYKFFPLKAFLKLGNFARAFHLGASIPMMSNSEIEKLDKNRLFSKSNGELNGFKNIFIIDSSNFPNIPSGSSSLTIMANAMRIGKENKND